jgi:transcriptional regulator with XRE-family HTH domain
MLISAAQLRAARGLLDWTRSELSKASGVSPETIKNIEHGIFNPTEVTVQALLNTFATHDVEFNEHDGVRKYQQAVKMFGGVEGFKKFMDDVYLAAQDASVVIDGDKPICVSNVDDRLFVEHLGDYANIHKQRMNDLKNVKVRVLIREQDDFMVSGASYLEYRWNPKQGVSNVPFYVYGDKFALIMFGEKPSPQVVVISSPLVSKAYREQFEMLWQNSRVPER